MTDTPACEMGPLFSSLSDLEYADGGEMVGRVTSRSLQYPTPA